MTAPELKPCPFCRCIPDGYEGRQVSCRCGAMGPIETPDDPESATWNDAHKHTQAAKWWNDVKSKSIEIANKLRRWRNRKLADDRAADVRERIMHADGERAKGVMSSLSRGSVLLHLEKVYSGDRGNNNQPTHRTRHKP